VSLERTSVPDADVYANRLTVDIQEVGRGLLDPPDHRSERAAVRDVRGDDNENSVTEMPHGVTDAHSFAQPSPHTGKPGVRLH
jgi:hypothetical protein